MLYFLRLGKMVDKEKIMEEGMKKYFLQKAVISNEGTKVKQKIYFNDKLHILNPILWQIEANKVKMMKIQYTWMYILGCLINKMILIYNDFKKGNYFTENGWVETPIKANFNEIKI